jgi:hypothetical protein
MAGLVDLLQILVGSSLQWGNNVLNRVRGAAVGDEADFAERLPASLMRTKVIERLLVCNAESCER